MPNQTIATVTITLKDDNDLESLEMFELNLIIDRDFRNIGVTEGMISTASVTVYDDDSKLASF